jgi:SAM-dependent methyltransferase
MLKKAAEKKLYTELHTFDLNQPFPLPSNHFGAVVCVGTLAYVHNTSVLEEFLRVTKPGGTIIFTHRSDLYGKLGYEAKQQELGAANRWEEVEIREEPDYMPLSNNFADIRVLYFVYRKSTHL